ncbi:MAG: AAA family ATPase [Verrucomicrobiota bacterium]
MAAQIKERRRSRVNAAPYPLGLVIGKFYPPHRGHHLLIDTALAACDHTIVIVCGKPSDSIPGETRRDWLQEMHTSAEIRLIDDRYDENDSAVWAENTLRWLGRAPDAVFTSEDYGDRYASLMGSRHILVDKPRLTIPISGTAVRTDPWANWDFISPPVRQWYARRVCLLGAESTGTTTLAKALAGRLRTAWVPEYGREYSEAKAERGGIIWHTGEFITIAREQARREDAAARACNRVLICDTNAFATTLWHRRYMGTRSPEVEALAATGQCDLYLLTGDEIPFVQDGLRDGEHLRHEMHQWFGDALTRQPVPWVLLSGPIEERLEKALACIRALFPPDSPWWTSSQEA